MDRRASLVVVVACMLATSGCLGILGGGASEPEMDAVDEKYNFSDLPAAQTIKGQDTTSPEIFTRLDKNESDPVTLRYTLVADGKNATTTHHRVTTVAPEKSVSLPDGVEGPTEVQVLVELRDGGETVDTFFGGYTYDPS